LGKGGSKKREPGRKINDKDRPHPCKTPKALSQRMGRREKISGRPLGEACQGKLRLIKVKARIIKRWTGVAGKKKVYRVRGKRLKLELGKKHYRVESAKSAKSQGGGRRIFLRV